MDNERAYAMRTQAREEGARSRVFDWDRAAKLIRKTKPWSAGAGLKADWEYTGGVIYTQDDGINLDNRTYLRSIWAIPELEMDGVFVDCWKWADETQWDEATKWPASAIEILHDIK